MGKNNNLNIDLNILSEDIDKLLFNVTKNMATQIRDDLYDEAVFAIEKFYQHYEPHFYLRGNGLKKTYKKLYQNSHGKTIKSGVSLSNDKMPNDYGIRNDYIFNLGYSGYHGNVSMFPNYSGFVPPIMTPSPLEIILNKRDNIISNIEKYKETALVNSRKDSYSILSF